MVDGHEMTADKNKTAVAGQDGQRVAVVDLDGTLICGNTLHIFARCALRDALRGGRLLDAAAISGLLALRLLRLCTHRTMKFGILRRARLTDSLRARFVARVDKDRCPAVAARLDSLRKDGCTLLLATAAADVYVPWIWHGDFLATPVADNPERRELRGLAKLAAVRRWCADHDATLYAVITDHADDLPLLTAGSKLNILVNPSPSTYAAVRIAGVNIDMTLK